jgi:DNA-binding NtrC family response regulator
VAHPAVPHARRSTPHKGTLLYVIGEAASSFYRKRLLEESGYSVVCIKNGDLAAKLLQSHPISLVLVDLAAKPTVNQIGLSVRKVRPNASIVILSSQDLMMDCTYPWADAFVNTVDQLKLLATVNLLLAA